MITIKVINTDTNTVLVVKKQIEFQEAIEELMGLLCGYSFTAYGDLKLEYNPSSRQLQITAPGLLGLLY